MSDPPRRSERLESKKVLEDLLSNHPDIDPESIRRVSGHTAPLAQPADSALGTPANLTQPAGLLPANVVKTDLAATNAAGGTPSDNPRAPDNRNVT